MLTATPSKVSMSIVTATARYEADKYITTVATPRWCLHRQRLQGRHERLLCATLLRCDNITVGYTWPSLINDALRLRLYGAVQNPFVITKYSGLDPEVFGVDKNIYPSYHRFARCGSSF